MNDKLSWRRLEAVGVVLRVRDGKITRFQQYADTAQARAAVGS